MLGYWITIKSIIGKTNLYYFTKKFIADKNTKMIVSISADSRYQLYINGNIVCLGPCLGNSHYKYYEKVDVTKYLRNGENEICVKVLHIVGQNFTTISPQTKPALWFYSEITTDNQTTYLYSDDSWNSYIDSNIEFIKSDKVLFSVAPFEKWIQNEDIVQAETTILSQCNLDTQCCTRWGTVDTYILKQRELPLINKSENCGFNITKKGNDFIEYDAGKYVTAFVDIEITIPKDVELKIIYAECYEKTNADGKAYKEKRDDISGFLKGPNDTIIGNGKRITFSPYWYRSFRFIRLECDDINKLIIHNISFKKYHYPLNITGEFQCSDSTQNKIWETSINTIECCINEIIMDCPYYEQQQYIMDSYIESMILFRMSSDYRLVRKAILDFAYSQTPDGLLYANSPASYCQIIPNYSLFWIIMLRTYVLYSGDINIIKDLIGTVEKIISWFINRINEKGLTNNGQYWPFVDWVKDWEIGVPIDGRTSSLTYTNLLLSYALKEASELCNLIGRNGLKLDYDTYRKELNVNILKYCYDKDKKLFKDTDTSQHYSQHTAIMAVLSELVIGDEAKELMERILNNKTISKCSYAMNYFLFRALEKTNLYKFCSTSFSGWLKMLNMNCSTWCESLDYPRSECHGWSSVPLYEHSAVILGVTPIANGFKKAKINPHTNYLDYAKGKVPTPYGDIYVSWKKENGNLFLEVISTKEITKEIVISKDETIVTNDEFFTINYKLPVDL